MTDVDIDTADVLYKLDRGAAALALDCCDCDHRVHVRRALTGGNHA